MAGESHPPPKPPTHNHSTSAVKPSSSHRSNSRLESSTPKATSNHKSSTSASAGGAQNTNPISSSAGVQKINPISSSAGAQKTNPPSSAGAPKTNPTSNNNTSTNTTVKPSPATPKVKPNPSPKPDDLSLRFDPPVSKLPPFPFLDPPPPPAYGFHMLDRGTIVLADGSVRSYFSLPRDYQDFPVMPPRQGQGFGFGRPLPMSPEFRGPGVVGERDARFMIEGRGGGPGPGEMSGNFLKRKFGEDEINGRDGYERQRQKLLQYGSVEGSGQGIAGHSSMYIGRGEQTSSPKSLRTSAGGNFLGLKHNEVDQSALKKAFLHFVKTIYENTNQMKMYLADGKHGLLPCLACGRSTKGFSDMHELVVHACTSENADSSVDHLGFHKALCILMGWNYRSPPDNSRRYQFLPADEAVANQEDLIMWPPLVIIHNTITGKGSDRMEGMGTKAMDSYLRDIGFGGGKAKPLYSKEGHLGVTLVKFNGDQSGLKEAVHLAEIFGKENRERKAWARVEPPSMAGMYDERNPHLVKVDERTGEKKRIFYGYLATVSDMDRVDFETKKTITIESKRELKLLN